MAQNEERPGGVLVIPQESWYPPSVTIKSPTETRTVPTKDGKGKEQAIFYTFKRGEPRRVESDQDYEILKQMTHYAGIRGVVPLFREVQPEKTLDGEAAIDKIVGELRGVLARQGINLDDLVDSAETVGLEADASPKSQEDAETGEE